MHTKKHGNAVLFIFRHYMLELRSKPCFKRLFEKSPLKIRKNFSPNNTTSFWQSFWVSKGLFTKSPLCQGLGQMPQLIMTHKKLR